MSAAFLIIDGYNLLHEAGLSQAKYASGDLHRQRHRLLVRLTNELSAEERIRCTVVFDAIEAPSGLERQFRHGEIAVMFAEPGHDADSLIEELIEAHSLAIIAFKKQPSSGEARASTAKSFCSSSQLARGKLRKQNRPSQA
jgi:predicted RNA-binding protein with PIN domain